MIPSIESFVFGAANSVHCAAMCGPLAIAFGNGPRSTAAYQGGRLFSYSLLGGGLGATGVLLGSDRLAAPSAWVSFVLAAGLIALALIGERGALRVPFLQRAFRRVTAAGRPLSATWRAALLGLCTPLLPCGLLWSACSGAAIAGSASAGAGVMAGFALGSLPLLLLAQSQLPALLRRASPRAIAIVQRAAILLAAGALAYRGFAALDGGCCHTTR